MTDEGVRLTLEVRGIEAVRGAIQNVRGGYERLVTDVASVLEGEARRLAKPHQQDTGELARSIVSDLGAVPEELRARVYSNHPAAVPMEFGRRAGAAMPPEEPVAEWMRRHGIDAPVFLIRRAIAERGTRPLRMFAGAYDVVQTRLSGLIRDAEAYIVQRWP